MARSDRGIVVLPQPAAQYIFTHCNPVTADVAASIVTRPRTGANVLLQSAAPTAGVAGVELS